MRVNEVELETLAAEKPVETGGSAWLRTSRGLLALIRPYRPPAEIEDDDVVEPERATAVRRPSAYLVSFILFVIAPAIAASLYFVFVASDQYVAETRFAVASAVVDTLDSNSKSSGSVSSMLGGLTASNDNSYLIAAYIRSRACIDEIGGHLDLVSIFRRPEADYWSRLKPSPSAEELGKYWRRMVNAYVDPPSGIVTVTVSAFRREDSLVIARAIVAASEKIANVVSERARSDIMKVAEREVSGAEDRVTASLADLRAFRESAGFVDPKLQAESTGKLLQQLVSQRIKLQTEFQVSSRAMSNTAPTLRSMKSRIDEVDEQIAAEKAKLTSAGAGSTAIASLLPRYEELVVKNTFAQKLYEMASDGLERARVRAAAQTIYVNVFVPPALPQDSLYPERFGDSAAIAAALLVLWGIGALVAALIEDHRL